MCLLLWFVNLKDTNMAVVASSDLASAARPPRVPLITLIKTASVCWWLNTPAPQHQRPGHVDGAAVQGASLRVRYRRKKVPLISSNCVFQSLSCNLEEVQMVKQHLFVLIPAYTRVN